MRSIVLDRLESLEAEVTRLRAEVDALRGRFDALAATGPAQRVVTQAPPPETGSYGAYVQTVAPLVGRTLLVLAGAFVLRALTDAGTVPAAVGVSLGLAYAAGVLVLVARSRGDGVAGFHGLAAVLVVFPLLHEATARFGLLGPRASAALLVLATAAVLGVAARRRLHGLAWLGTGAALLTAATLALATGRVGPATLALVAVGAMTLWLGYVRDWHALRWPAAAAADLAVVILLGRAAAPGAVEGPGLALLVLAALVLAYLGSFAARTLYLGRSVVVFEMAQTAALLVTGLGGAAFLASRSGAGTTGLGWAAFGLAAVAYGVAFAFVERRQPGSANFPFYAAIALAFTLAGAWLALPGWARGTLLGALALAAAAVGRLRSRRTLAVHAAAYAALAAVSAGLLERAADALLSSAPTLPTPEGVALGVIASLAVATMVAAGGGSRTGLAEGVPQLVLDVVLAVSLVGLVAGVLGHAVGSGAAGLDPGALGTVRSAVLAAAAVAAAWLGRYEAGREASWLAWPIAALLGLKLAVEDFPRGRPATLILSLALAGAALILVPRLRERRRALAHPAPPGIP